MLTLPRHCLIDFADYTASHPQESFYQNSRVEIQGWSYPNDAARCKQKDLDVNGAQRANACATSFLFQLDLSRAHQAMNDPFEFIQAMRSEHVN